MIIARYTFTLAVLFAVALAGCGAGAAPAGYEEEPRATAGGTGAETAEPQLVHPTPADQQVVTSYEEDMQSLDADFLSNMELSTGPDCDLARDLRDRICDLADRICDIAGRHPEHGDVSAKCEDGRGRCDRARERVAESCGE